MLYYPQNTDDEGLVNDIQQQGVLSHKTDGVGRQTEVEETLLFAVEGFTQDDAVQEKTQPGNEGVVVGGCETGTGNSEGKEVVKGHIEPGGPLSQCDDQRAENQKQGIGKSGKQRIKQHGGSEKMDDSELDHKFRIIEVAEQGNQKSYPKQLQTPFYIAPAQGAAYAGDEDEQRDGRFPDVEVQAFAVHHIIAEKLFHIINQVKIYHEEKCNASEKVQFPYSSFYFSLIHNIPPILTYDVFTAA